MSPPWIWRSIFLLTLVVHDCRWGHCYVTHWNLWVTLQSQYINCCVIHIPWQPCSSTGSGVIMSMMTLKTSYTKPNCSSSRDQMSLTRWSSELSNYTWRQPEEPLICQALVESSTSHRKRYMGQPLPCVREGVAEKHNHAANPNPYPIPTRFRDHPYHLPHWNSLSSCLVTANVTLSDNSVTNVIRNVNRDDDNLHNPKPPHNGTTATLPCDHRLTNESLKCIQTAYDKLRKWETTNHIISDSAGAACSNSHRTAVHTSNKARDRCLCTSSSLCTPPTHRWNPQTAGVNCDVTG